MKDLRLDLEFIIGDEHVVDDSVMDGNIIYTVVITNLTNPPIIFDEIVLAYNRNDLPGCVLLVEQLILPTESRPFQTVPCTLIGSFAIALYWHDESGQEQWATIPGPDEPITVLVPPLGSIPCYAFIDLHGALPDVT